MLIRLPPGLDTATFVCTFQHTALPAKRVIPQQGTGGRPIHPSSSSIVNVFNLVSKTELGPKDPLLPLAQFRLFRALIHILWALAGFHHGRSPAVGGLRSVEVESLIEILPNVVLTIREAKYEHLDTMWADSAKDRVFPRVSME